MSISHPVRLVSTPTLVMRLSAVIFVSLPLAKVQSYGTTPTQKKQLYDVSSIAAFVCLKNDLGSIGTINLDTIIPVSCLF